MVSAKEILMGRDNEFPLDEEQFYNLLDLLPRINLVRFHYNKPLYVSSGYRPGRYNSNAGGAAKSSHLTCEAVDFADPNGSFALWCLDNLATLKKAGLFMEDPRWTPGWVHLQSRKVRSGNRVFVPNSSPAARPDFWDGKYPKEFDV